MYALEPTISGVVVVPGCNRDLGTNSHRHFGLGSDPGPLQVCGFGIAAQVRPALGFRVFVKDRISPLPHGRFCSTGFLRIFCQVFHRLPGCFDGKVFIEYFIPTLKSLPSYSLCTQNSEGRHFYRGKSPLNANVEPGQCSDCFITQVEHPGKTVNTAYWI